MGLRADLHASIQIAQAVHLARWRREVNRIVKRLPQDQQTPQAIAAILSKSLQLDNAPEVLPPLDPQQLSSWLLHTAAIACVLEFDRVRREARPILGARAARPPVQTFADLPWTASVKAFLARTAVSAPDQERVLAAFEDDETKKILPDFLLARENAYRRSFTMVREANQKITARVQQVIERVTTGAASPEDARIDMDDLYRSLGLSPQDPAYSRLVINNAVNRAWQEGNDSVLHQISADGTMTPDDTVWGYEWIHGDSLKPRASHLAMDGHRAPHADPVWQTFGPPPIAHNCHCTRLTRTIYWAARNGYLKDDLEIPTDKTRRIETPTVTTEHLRKSGVDDKLAGQVAGKPATEVMRHSGMTGDHFPRSRYNTDRNPLLHPSGVKGDQISDKVKALLNTEATGPEILRAPQIAQGLKLTPPRTLDNWPNLVAGL